ncbi:hypothetical protein GH714_025679 [Hevea brasiliensis]|uniref:Anthocyanidin 3-O-glucosyltransferase n=1 Tax=Hevea brasiliensis TaxID=3981 RepID=A0A6A6KTR6_HEVBR|nr:hypothetical protein GH714_025679 [Hevea brasiliensis]
MKGIRLRDIPSFIRTTDPEDGMLEFIISETKRAQKATAIILNTFDALEHDVLSALSPLLPPVYSIGSLQLLLNNVKDEDLKLIGSNLWKEESGCLEWLDSKKPNSVVYVNFGSITVMTSEQLVEFAWGLANSNKTFLWVIRPDLVAGIPRCKEWGIGMEINSNVKRDEVESLVIELMDSDKGKQMKKKAMEWRKMAEEAAASSDGSSFQSLNNLINQALLSSSRN